MPKYIPGNPTILVQNKANLAGTLLDFSNNLADDGTLLGIFPETIGIQQLTDPDIAVWDVRKLAYVGSFANVNPVFFLRKDAQAKNVDDFKTVSTNVGCSSRVDQSYSKSTMLKNFLGYQFKIICGYNGNAGLPIALLQGELDVVVSAWNGWRDRAEVKNGTFKPVIQAGLKRHRDLPNVPLMQDLMTDPTQKKVAEFWSAGSAIGRALVVRASAPAERINALRTAFDKAMADPALIAEAAKTNLEIDPTSGTEVQRISMAILDTPKDVVTLAVNAVQ
jgi:tripartite-type tricarboxylate transporter receptor subunit TctC